MSANPSSSSTSEVQKFAKLVFIQFFKDRLKDKGIKKLPLYEGDDIEKSNYELVRESLNTTDQHMDPTLINLAKEMKKIAIDFEKTKIREKIKKNVENFDVEDCNIDYDRFKNFLSRFVTKEIVTEENVIVLFYFCSELLLKALRGDRIYYCVKLLNLSLTFIFDIVCGWVDSKGGWTNVFNNNVSKFLFSAVGFLTCIGLATYFKRSL